MLAKKNRFDLRHYPDFFAKGCQKAFRDEATFFWRTVGDRGQVGPQSARKQNTTAVAKKQQDAVASSEQTSSLSIQNGPTRLLPTQVAIVAPKKYFHLATARNAIKRRLHRLVAEKIKTWPSNLQIVIIAKTNDFADSDIRWPKFKV